MDTLLTYVKRCDYDGCLYALDVGIDPNIKDDLGWTPLHFACMKGDQNCVKLLLDRHANPNIINNKDATPLYTATVYNKTNCVKLLLEYGVDTLITDPILLKINPEIKALIEQYDVPIKPAIDD